MALPVAPAQTSALTSLPPGPAWPTAVQTVLWQLRFPEFNTWLSRRYGNIFTIRLPFSGSMVSVTDPDTIRALFADPGERTHAGEANAILEPMLGRHSVLLLDGPGHTRQRKLLHPPFHGARMQRYSQVITDVTAAEVAAWPMDRSFSLLRSMQSLTLQVILRVVFGLEEGEKLEHIKTLIHRALADGDSPLALIPQARRDFGPLKTWTDFIARRDALDQALYAEMTARREAGNLQERDDILSMLMVSRDEDGEGMSDVELRDELITLLLAGHETTASSVSWFFDQVLHQEGVLGRLQADLAGGGVEYLNAAITETMRLRPAVPMIARLLKAPMEIDDFLIPAGVVVAPNIFLAHRRADVYPEPLRFRPERFLESKVDTFAWLPFGGGIRRCVGAAFATFEMQTVIPEVLRRVKLAPVSPRPEPIARRAVTLVPARGAMMRVTARN
jgi:cytochrome P450